MLANPNNYIDHFPNSKGNKNTQKNSYPLKKNVKSAKCAAIHRFSSGFLPKVCPNTFGSVP